MKWSIISDHQCRLDQTALSQWLKKAKTTSILTRALTHPLTHDRFVWSKSARLTASRESLNKSGKGTLSQHQPISVQFHSTTHQLTLYNDAIASTKITPSPNLVKNPCGSSALAAGSKCASNKCVRATSIHVAPEIFPERQARRAGSEARLTNSPSGGYVCGQARIH